MGWHVRVVAILFVMLGLIPETARACSCDGTTSIGTALGFAETVVLGRVEGRRQIPPDRRNGMIEIYPEAAVVKVLKVLKGSAPAEILVSADFMCYRSFNVEDFNLGETFVFPIIQTTDQGVNVLPSCSHSALKLIDGQVYTNELVSDGGRRLQAYMRRSFSQMLLPMGVLDTRRQMMWVGSLALLACVLVTTRMRKKRAIANEIEQRPSPVNSLRSMRWRSVFAVAWMVLCAGVCILAGISEWDWLPSLLGIMFLVAAAGIALRWAWAEGVSYGLALIWIGACAMLTLDGMKWLVTHGEGVDERLYYLLAVALVCVAGMVWCAAAVRRRFSETAS
jgi:hypothetical protein